MYEFTWGQQEQHTELLSTHLQDQVPCRLRSSGTSAHLLHLLHWLTSSLNRTAHNAKGFFQNQNDKRSAFSKQLLMRACQEEDGDDDEEKEEQQGHTRALRGCMKIGI